MDIYQLQKQRRTIRKYKDKKIDDDKLIKFVEYARLSPSGSNTQPVKYMIINDDETGDKIFSNTRWAGYLKGAGTPSFDERPRAYILLLVDTRIKENCQHDIGAAAQAIQLMAYNEGIGCCWIGSINRDEVAQICNLESHLKIDTLIAFGYPAESPLFEDVKDGDIKYYKDETGRLHVPKRSVGEVLIK